MSLYLFFFDFSQGGAQHFHANQICKAYLAEIHSPSRFWMHLAEPEIDSLIVRMREFYNNTERSDPLKFDTIKDVQIGLQISVFLHRMWHRAEVINVTPTRVQCT